MKQNKGEISFSTFSSTIRLRFHENTKNHFCHSYLHSLIQYIGSWKFVHFILLSLREYSPDEKIVEIVFRFVENSNILFL